MQKSWRKILLTILAEDGYYYTPNRYAMLISEDVDLAIRLFHGERAKDIVYEIWYNENCDIVN